MSDQGLWVPWSSAADLLRAARDQGTPVTERLIVDWTEKGLIDRPRSRGLGQARGREKGRWPRNQRQLFLILLQKRPSRRSRFPALFNIPVFMWLVWGDAYVPLRQVRRCLLSWHRRLHTSERSLQRAARKRVRALAHPDATKEARKVLTDQLQLWARDINVQPRILRRLLMPVIDPHRTGQPRGPRGAQLSFDSYLAGFEAQILGEIYLQEFSDGEFLQAREMYRASRASYTREWRRFAADEDLGHMFEEPTLDVVASSACVDLTRILGFIQKGTIDGTNRRTPPRPS